MILLRVLLPSFLLFTCAAIQADTNSVGTLRGTVIDSASGQPMPCTVMLTDSTGKIVVEHQSFTRGFRCSGRFEKRLPAGQARLRVTRGFEFRAIERTLNIPADETVDVTVRMERAVDLRRRGWYAGDSHVHMIHGENTLPVSFDDVALAARAEDLQYLSLAQAWTMHQPSPQKLEAELSRRSTPDCVVTWNLEAPKNYYRGDAGRCLGHCWNLAMRGDTRTGENLIATLLQASAHDYESEKPVYANFESHRLIHSQGGTVFYTHPARWWWGSWGGQGGYPKQERMRVSNMAVELPLDTLTGPTYDGIDLITGSGEFEANAKAFELWAMLLNRGYRLAGTGSSDSCFDRPGGGTPGVTRLYSLVEGAFSLPKVARAAGLGHNFVTTGPLLLASVDGKPPGSRFPAGKNRTLKVEAWASGTDAKGLSSLELLRNGRPIQTNIFSPNVPSFQTNIMVAGAKEDAWYCVRLFGGDPQRQRAISGAFFFESKDYRPPASVKANVNATLLDATSGQPIAAGTLTEVTFEGTTGRDGRRHSVKSGQAQLSVPATVRLRAEAKGYAPQTLSPFLDSPRLVELITGLSDTDLLDWRTFERIQRELSSVTLVFRLEKAPTRNRPRAGLPLIALRLP